MRNTVSLHKACIAKFFGLLVLAALAVVFFVTPIAMAMGGATPTLNNNVKVYFLGKVAGTTGTTVTSSQLPLALNKIIKPSQVETGSWFLCAVKDATNTFSIFTCSVAGLTSNKITANDVASNQIGVVLGLPTNVSATSPTAMTYVGKKGHLLYTLKSGLVTTPAGVEQALQATGTGW
jgi:hypothetical protein